MPILPMLLSACGSHEAPRVVLTERCELASAATPVSVSFDASRAAILRVRVEPRGISVQVSAGADRARSQVDRLGVITLVKHARDGETVTVNVESRDSPDIVGSVCVSIAELPASDEARLRAERAFASAGEHLQAGDPKRSFDEYLNAAREFDSFDHLRAAEARHAMAEIAYGKISREDDAYWLARMALNDFGEHASAGLQSALLSLQARTLLESEIFDETTRRARVFELLNASQRLAERDSFAAREIPRLDILRGFMEYRGGDPAKANAYFSKAASRCEALRDWECYARALQNSASLAEEARDYTVALKAYADALRVLPPRLDPELTATIWGNQGRLQGTAGLFQQSEQSHRVSIRMHAEIDDCEGARVGTARLGGLLVQVGSIAEGLDQLSHAASLSCAELLPIAKVDSAPATAAVGDACMNTQAPESLGPSGKLAVFSALLGLRDALQLENRPAEAKRCLAAAHEYASTPRTRLRLANAEGNALLEESRVEAANATFEKGLASADKEGIPNSYEHRSLAYLGLARAALMEKQVAVARGYASRSLVLGSARADVNQIVESLQLMARSYSTTPDSEQAISILHTAADLVDQVPIDDLDAEKRATWLATQHAVFSELTALFAAGGEDEEARVWQAFDASERGRAKSLRYAANLATDTGSEAPGEPSSARYQELMQRIAGLAHPVQAGQAPQLSMPELQDMAHGNESPADDSSRKDLQQRLATLDATAIEYATGRDEMYAFVIDSEHIRVAHLGSRAKIASAAAALYEQVRNPEAAETDVQRAAAKLAGLVLWPITSEIEHRRVILIPDDALHTVPFALLPWSAEKDSPLLVERAELSVMPSTHFVTRSRAPSSAHTNAPRFELIGDPVFRASDCGNAANVTIPVVRRSLPRLPGSRKEVLAIADLAQRVSPAAHVKTRLGCEATPTALRAAAATSPELLHIATHGYVDAYRPRLSALALTQDSAANGGASSIGLLDILNMRVTSRLVVLSACDTSRGRLLPGEGVLGPAQAFLQAGAASVIASYWRIPDEHTAPFMEAFYRYLLVDRLSAAAALRRTQLDYARDRASHDWAAFTLYGWPDTAL
jgi:CHAT domain-containing protein